MRCSVSYSAVTKVERNAADGLFTNSSRKGGGALESDSTIILDVAGVKRALTRIAHEVLEKNKGVEDLVLVGIRTGGVYLARELPPFCLPPDRPDGR
jgi:hypothetical protein